MGLHSQSRTSFRRKKDGEGEKRRLALKKEDRGVLSKCYLTVSNAAAEGHHVRQPRQNTPSDSAQAEQMGILTHSTQKHLKLGHLCHRHVAFGRSFKVIFR